MSAYQTLSSEADVDQVLERIAKERITMLPGPPALYQTILARPDLARFDLSSLRLAVTGAASIPVELIHQMRDVLKFDSVVTAYGLTETSGCVSICRQGDSAETIAKGEDGAQAPSAANKVEDKPYDKLTTSKLAKPLGMRTGELNDKLITAGLLMREDDQFKLTDRGKAAGGEFRFSKKFGPFFIWPSDLAV